MQFNKGNSDFDNRIPHIEIILKKYNPHILVVNEANVEAGDITSNNAFPNYTMECNNLSATNTKSRTIMLIKRNINYKRQRDLEYPLI